MSSIYSVKKLFWLLAFLLFALPTYAQFPDHTNYVVSSGGSANAQTLAVPNYVGPVVRGLMAFTNTGPMTLAVNGTGVLAVKKRSLSGLVALAGGEITSGQIAEFIYDGTQYELIGGSTYTAGNGLSLGGLGISSFNGNVTNNNTDNITVNLNCSVQAYGNLNLQPVFSDANCAQMAFNSVNVDNTYSAGNAGGQTLAKTTTTGLLEQGTFLGGGQKILNGYQATCYGISDCALSTSFVTFAGVPIAGDEGTGFTDVNLLSQQTSLTLSTITSIPTQSTMNTTITQAVAASASPQTVTVASSSGCSTSAPWVIIGQQLPANNDNKEAVQITACGSGTITAIIRNNFNTGATLTPATVLNLNSTFQSGQGRVMVDVSQPTYSTGTVASISGGGFIGSGTSWANNMVGGNATNIGCIALNADTYSGSPFNGSGANGPLKSYYQIDVVTNGTSLGIYTTSVAGDAAYHGLGPGSGGYTIYPCAEILYLGNNNGSVTGLVVLESSSSTWTVGDTIETAIGAFPDVDAFQYHLVGYTPGGVWRGFMDIVNIGAVQFQTGISIRSTGQPAGTPAAETPAWNIALSLNNAVNGIGIGGHITSAAILLTDGTFASADCLTDACGKIIWGNGPYIAPNGANNGFLDINLTGGASGLLQAVPLTGVAQLHWGGVFDMTAQNFSVFPACSSGAVQDSIAAMLSNTATLGATITGNGSNRIIAHCNGSNWTVMGN